MKELPVKELQERVAARRDQKAYKELFLRFYTPLTGFSLPIVKSSEAAEDVVSDVMLNVWNLGEALLKVDNLTVYLYRATKNRSINYITRKPAFTSTDNDRIADCLASSDLNPCEAMQKAELSRCFSAAVAALPPKCAMVYHLVKEEGLTYRQAAAVLSISENTVDRHLNNALHKLMKAVRLHLAEQETVKNQNATRKKLLKRQWGKFRSGVSYPAIASLYETVSGVSKKEDQAGIVTRRGTGTAQFVATGQKLPGGDAASV